MKKTVIVFALVCMAVAGFTSCTTQRGCKMTQGYIGYGGRH